MFAKFASGVLRKLNQRHTNLIEFLQEHIIEFCTVFCANYNYRILYCRQQRTRKA